MEVATSLSVKCFTQLPNRNQEYLQALPENIHIASAWGKLGGGFSGAFINGYNTAKDLLKR